MSAPDLDWVRSGAGQRPTLAWTFATEAPLVALKLARESGEVLAADQAGGLYLLDRQGRVVVESRAPAPVRAIGWSDTGSGGIALVEGERVGWFNRKLAFEGWAEHTDPVLGIALEAHGHVAAVSLNSCVTLVYDANRRQLRRFTSMQPLATLEFLMHRPALVAVTEYGLLTCHELSGEQLWQTQLWANVGDISVSADGRAILLASYAHGIQRYDEQGTQVGSYQVGGTVSRLSRGLVSGRIAAATMERSFYFLREQGEVCWQSAVPDDVCRLACDPLKYAAVCGFQSGQIVRLEWEG